MHLCRAKKTQIMSGKMLQPDYYLKTGDLESFKFPLNDGASFSDPRQLTRSTLFYQACQHVRFDYLLDGLLCTGQKFKFVAPMKEQIMGYGV